MKTLQVLILLYSLLGEKQRGKFYICKREMPALLVELKWNQKAYTALEQIKEKQYVQAIKNYTGDVLFVGISYDKKSKKHECVIEEYRIEA